MKFKILETFHITDRGLVVVLDGFTGLAIGVAHPTRITTPSGASHSSEAYNEWLLRRTPEPVENEAFILEELAKDDVPIGSVVEFGGGISYG